MVGRSHKNVLNEIFITGTSAHSASTTSSLCTELGSRSALHIAQVRNSNYNILFLNQVFNAHLVIEESNICFTGITKLVFYFSEFILNDLVAYTFVSQYFT